MSDVPWKCWERRLGETAKAVEKLRGDVSSVSVAAPARSEEVQDVEQQLGRPLPPAFRSVLLGFSRHVEFQWSLPEDAELPTGLDEIFSGECGWDLRDLVAREESRQSWVKECFPNPDDPYDRVWHRKLGWYTVSNGDCIGFDTEGGRESVVYLSHDDGDGHGYVLGASFIDYMDRLTRLGCVGPEDWQWTVFCPNASAGLGADGEPAQRWREWLGLSQARET